MCFANSGEPASVTIITKNDPVDLEISFLIDDIVFKAEKKVKHNEAYFYYYNSLLDFEAYGKVSRVYVKSEEKSFEIDISNRRLGYSEVFTLDFDDETLNYGKSPFRSLKLVLIRVTMTLLIEGLVFYLWGYRDKKSWIYFILINLVTQGYLNIMINLQLPVGGEYMVRVILIFEELKILVMEWLFMLLLIKENKRLKLILFVFVANLISLLAGLMIIPALPI
jgi:hypothetical protein